MAGSLPFSLTLLLPRVGLGYSGRGAITALRTAGYSFGDHPFWEAWRTAASYKKGEWRASQLPTGEYVPAHLWHETAELSPGKRLWAFTTLERNMETGELSQRRYCTTADIDETIEEAKMVAWHDFVSHEEYHEKRELVTMSFSGAWLGEAA